MSRPAKTLQIDTEEQLIVRLAWACEIEGLTQAAAAERFGVTRLRVNKLLADARARGIVRVSIDSPLAPCAGLEWALCQKFGLSTASVAPKVEEHADLHKLVGSALGQYLTKYLDRDDVRLFGMSWGNTLNMATRFMEPLDRPDLEIISVMGGLTKGSDLNSFEITTRLADLCNAEHSYFTAPLYAGSRESRDILVEQDVFQTIIEKIRSANALAIAAGEMSESLLVKDGLPGEISVAELREAGAVGDILGYMLDETGRPIDHPINERVLGVNLDDLADVPNVILAAGGMHKLAIIKAILLTGYVDTLVTDQSVAEALTETA